MRNSNPVWTITKTPCQLGACLLEADELAPMSRERVNRKLRHPAANSHLILAQKLGQFPMCPTSWKMMQQLKQQQEQQEQQHQQQQLLKSSSSQTYQVQGCQDPY
ncbi:GD18935 [Drosophila simulans]|uniref:GD18935 n=1 Tax=Drosophila simulans TaxID=7240 RepID=B4R0K8_DROSI|nr:GD18935 [Drosophila simulans]